MSPEPDTEDANVFILVGRARRADSDGAAGNGDDVEALPVNILLTAPDEEAAIKRALAVLASEGYGRVELDRIGVIDGEPEDPTFAAAYWNAIDGEVAVITFHG